MFKSDIGSPFITRRAFFIAAGATAAAVVFELRKNIVYAAAPPKEVKIVQFTPAGQRGEIVTLPVVVSVPVIGTDDVTSSPIALLPLARLNVLVGPLVGV